MTAVWTPGLGRAPSPVVNGALRDLYRRERRRERDRWRHIHDPRIDQRLPLQCVIALVGSANFYSTDTNGFTSASVDTTGATFIAVWYAGATATHALSDSKSNTWTALTATTAFFGTREGQWYYAYNATVGSGHTFTITGTSTAPTLQVLWFSGVKSSADPFDTGQQSGNSNNSSTTIQAGSVTPSEDNCLILSGLYKDSSFTGPSIDGGFTREQYTTNTDFGHFYGSAADLIQTTAAAANPTWTVSSGDIVISRNAVFKAAAAGGGATPGQLVDAGLVNHRLVNSGLIH